MKCLSIRQPWLNEIARGEKRVENRTWRVPPAALDTVIALHASKTVDWDAEFPPGKSWRWEHDQPEYREPFHEGHVIAVARIAGCHFATGCDREVNDSGRLEYCSEWAMPDQHHWVLGDVRLLSEPVPHKGTLGLRPLPDDIESAVRAQMGAGNG